MKATATLLQELNQALWQLTAKSTTNNNAQLNEPALVYGSFFQNKAMLSQAVRNGLPHTIFAIIKRFTPFSDSDWANYLDVSVKTLQRHREEKSFVFKSIHSEKILELAEVAQFGLDVFDNQAQFYDWLQLPSIALAGNTPAELLKDSFGKELVMAELTRIEHGVFA
jgi:putative toxin-antitoxin system antitoxin component (TIGR02293 family)